MSSAPSPSSPGADVPTRGRVLPHARYYDAGAWLLTLGRDRRLRRKTVQLAGVRPGDAVLEIGCGTGSLALAAKAVAGRDGRVCGIDPSADMLAVARAKAAKQKLAVDFQPGAAEQLPFADGEFDVVLTSLVLHHLPGDIKAAAIREARRVLRPGGRFLAVDLPGHGHAIFSHIFPRASHGGDQVAQVPELLIEAGFSTIESGSVGIAGLRYWHANVPRTGEADGPS